METPLVQSRKGVTLIGGARVSAAALAAALRLAPVLVAADGGADRALRHGHVPVAAIGDFDSISAAARRRMPPDRLHRIEEQDSTDFDKALRSVAAPFVLGLGFSGRRMDHGLAVLNTLARRDDQRCVILGGADLIFAAPRELALDLPRGTRVSLFPLAPVQGESEGLVWPIGGIGFAPGGSIGTSNAAAGGPVRLRFDAAGMLVILPRVQLGAVLDGLLPGWRAL